MFELLTVILFVWLLYNTLRLSFKITLGIAKVGLMLLAVLAIPGLIGCLLFASGILIFVPVLIVAVTFGILKQIVE